ncbi:hypothetical protein [Croceimicrobium sp.]|uniref:hypothetical protein n=1 Tax=Croceimicrobium sp. TaxID=2828340 RepID=UPI003BAAC016
MKTKSLQIIALGLIILSLSSCAPSGFEEEPAGFFYGLWHGFIIFFSTLGKLFGRDIGIHALNNTGWPYWLGFLIGLSSAIGGGSRAASHKKRKARRVEN